MSFLFYRKKNKDKFLKEFNRVKEAIKKGVTPVSSEIRIAKTSLLELPLHLLFNSMLLILSTILISKINVGDLFKIVIVLVINTIANTLSNIIVIFIKQFLRVKCLKRFGLEVNEDNIAVLECLEYQSV